MSAVLPSRAGTRFSEEKVAPGLRWEYPRASGCSHATGTTWPRLNALVEMYPAPGSSGKRSIGCVPTGIGPRKPDSTCSQ